MTINQVYMFINWIETKPTFDSHQWHYCYYECPAVDKPSPYVCFPYFLWFKQNCQPLCVYVYVVWLYALVVWFCRYETFFSSQCIATASFFHTRSINEGGKSWKTLFFLSRLLLFSLSCIAHCTVWCLGMIINKISKRNKKKRKENSYLYLNFNK